MDSQGLIPLDRTSVKPVAELSGMELMARLMDALSSPCSDRLHLSFYWHNDRAYIATSCGDGCSERSQCGTGASHFDAMIDLIHTTERRKRLDVLKQKIRNVDTSRPIDIDALTAQQQALVSYGVYIGQGLRGKE